MCFPTVSGYGITPSDWRSYGQVHLLWVSFCSPLHMSNALCRTSDSGEWGRSTKPPEAMSDSKFKVLSKSAYQSLGNPRSDNPIPDSTKKHWTTCFLLFFIFLFTCFVYGLWW